MKCPTSAATWFEEQCVKQVPYTICKPVHYTKTIQCCHYGAQASGLHGHPLLPASGVQASASASVLPSTVLLRLHED